MLMSDLTHRLLACKAHLNMLIENAPYKFITITISDPDTCPPFLSLAQQHGYQKGMIHHSPSQEALYLVWSAP